MCKYDMQMLFHVTKWYRNNFQDTNMQSKSLLMTYIHTSFKRGHENPSPKSNFNFNF